MRVLVANELAFVGPSLRLEVEMGDGGEAEIVMMSNVRKQCDDGRESGTFLPVFLAGFVEIDLEISSRYCNGMYRSVQYSKGE